MTISICKLRNISLLLVLLALAFAAGVQPTFSQQEKFTGLKLRAIANNDFVYEYTVNPGDTISGKFIAQHDFQNTNASKLYYVLASDFSVDPETGVISYPRNFFYENARYSIARQLEFNTDQVKLNKFGEEQVIEFKATVPADAKGGTYYAAIVLSNISPREYQEGLTDLGSTSGAGVGSRLAPVVIVNVNGNNVVTGEIEEIEILNQAGVVPFMGIHEYVPVNIKTSFKNTGNYAINPTGNLFIHQGDIANPLANFQFNDKKNRVLPETTRPYFNTWEDGLLVYTKESVVPGGVVNVKENADLRIGRYFATVKTLYKDNSNELKVSEKTQEFWILPWKLILALISVLVIIGYVLYRYLQVKESPGHKVKKQKSRK